MNHLDWTKLIYELNNWAIQNYRSNMNIIKSNNVKRWRLDRLKNNNKNNKNRNYGSINWILNNTYDKK